MTPLPSSLKNSGTFLPLGRRSGSEPRSRRSAGSYPTTSRGDLPAT
jgi:hypothetical protein